MIDILIFNRKARSIGHWMYLILTRCLLLVLGSLIFAFSFNSAQADPSYDWQRISPVEAGFLPNMAEKLDDLAVQTKEFDNLHAVIVARGGKLVLERYYEGEDRRTRGPALGTVKFGPEVKHDLRSVTKSIVGLLYGVALADGKVPDLDQSLVGQYPAYEDLAADPKRGRMTVRHALSMTLGTEWDEGLPYTDPRNSETAMDRAPDRYRYVLERPMVAEPGTVELQRRCDRSACETDQSRNRTAVTRLCPRNPVRTTGDHRRGMGRRFGRRAVCGIGSAHATTRSRQDRPIGPRSRSLG